MRAILTGVFVCVSALTAYAQSIPDYPVERWCDRVASAVGSRSEVIYGSCINQEQGAYDGLKPRWASVPAANRQWCDRVARAAGHGSYVLLSTCIEQETSAGQANQRQQFRR